MDKMEQLKGKAIKCSEGFRFSLSIKPDQYFYSCRSSNEEELKKVTKVAEMLSGKEKEINTSNNPSKSQNMHLSTLKGNKTR